MNVSPPGQRALLDLARRVIRGKLRGGEVLAPEPTPEPELLQPTGCFVSLHGLGSHQLRGCVGRLDATQPMWAAVRHAAQCVLDDPRFADDDPVTAAELPQLELEISLLSPLRPAASLTGFDPWNEGMYLTVGGRSGCFLPQVARETGWTRGQLLERLCTEKLGLPPYAWRDPDATLMVFTTRVIGPEPFENE